MRENAKVAALVLAVGVAWAVPGVAQETTDEQTTEGATREHHKEHAEGGHEAYRNSLGFFLGVTDEPGHDLEGTWGLEYTRLVARRWGVGAVGEYAGGDLRNTVLIAFGAWTPWKDLELFAGPGVEFHDGRSSGEPHRESGGEGDSDNDKTYFIFRLGVGWHLHLSHRFGLVPAVNFDLVDGENVWVYGLNLTYGF